MQASQPKQHQSWASSEQAQVRFRSLQKGGGVGQIVGTLSEACSSKQIERVKDTTHKASVHLSPSTSASRSIRRVWIRKRYRYSSNGRSEIPRLERCLQGMEDEEASEALALFLAPLPDLPGQLLVLR